MTRGREGGLLPGQVNVLFNCPGRFAIHGYALNTPFTLWVVFALQDRSSWISLNTETYLFDLTSVFST